MLISSLYFSCFAVAWRVVFFVIFVENRCALAGEIKQGPDERFPPVPGKPDVSDYPSMDEIEKNLRDDIQDLEFVIMAVSQGHVPQYLAYSELPGKVGIFSAFKNLESGQNFLARDGRSERYYTQFYDDCNTACLKRVGSNVKVMTDDGKVPGLYNCRYFVDHEYNVLQENPNVGDVFFIQSKSPAMWTLWRPGDQYLAEPLELDTPQAQPSGVRGGGVPQEQGRAPSHVMQYVGTGVASGLAGWTLSSMGVFDSAISALKNTPPWKALFGDGDDHKLDEPDPGVKSDVIYSPVGALPPFKPVAGDESIIPMTDNTPSIQGTSLTGDASGTESAMGGVPGAGDNSNPELGTDGTTPSDDKIAYDGSSDPPSLSQGRRRGLRRRSSAQCENWILNFADYVAAHEQPQAAASPPASNSASPQLDGLIPNVFKDSSSFATVQVTQHLQGSDGIYPLDISILKDGAMINNMLNQRPPAGTEIEVPIPWDTNLPENAPLIGAPANHPLYVKPGLKDLDPIQFRYADVNLASPQLGLGLTFDSNDEDHTHNCKVSPWSGGERHVECSFTVFHPHS